MSQSLLKWLKATNTTTTTVVTTTNITSTGAPTTTSNDMIMLSSKCATTTTNAPFTSMVSPPSTGSNSGSDLEDLRLGDSATADPGVNSSALQDDVSTAQDLMCHSGSPLSPAVQPAATFG